jgi:TonB family protein
MKRSIFVATLALTPALLHAQASLPAQTSSPAVLQARANTPVLKAELGAADPKTVAATRVSTGIIAPTLLKSIDLASLAGLHTHVVAHDMTVVVDMTVDASGKTQNISIEKSAGDMVDQQVLTAVRQAYFQPGKLDGQPYGLPVRLQVLIKAGAQY